MLTANRKLTVGILAVLLISGAGGYLLGTSRAPTFREAGEVERLSFRKASANAFAESFERAQIRGARAGTKRGRAVGRSRGQEAGQSAGSGDAEVRLAEIAESQEPSGIPSPFASGEILPPIPAGANEPNPTELCNQAPISAAELGYSCP